MTATRSISRKSWALLTALMLFAALVVPILAAQKAEAATPDNACRLDVTAEVSTNPTGATHTLVANVVNSTGGATGTSPCNDSTSNNYEVDFEVESGAAVTFNATSTSTSTGASDADNSPTSPDATCTVGEADIVGTPEVNESSQCTVQFTSATAGTNVIRAWVDDDKDNSTVDADTTEGRDEATVPGNRTEIDDTDVVSKTWFVAPPANLRLDCDDESGDDTQTNPAGQAETYTCHAYSDTSGNQTQDAGEPNVAGLLIDAENLSGANDPDNSAATGTADFNDACTTAANGSCTFVLSPSENEVGAADVCFWADVDTDSAFDTAGSVYDGTGCSEVVGATENDNETDKVTKTWATVGVTAAVLDASPEVDNNASGTAHPMTATVVDQFDTPVPNIPVDFDVESGRNVAQATVCNNVLTNASGVATCSYTDSSAIGSGNDTINVYVDTFQDAGEARETEDSDRSDTILKVWTAGGPPAAASTVIDMIGTGGSGGAADCSDTAVGTPQSVGAVGYLVCGDVLSAALAGIPGAAATFTTNLGYFTNAAGTTNLGQSFATTSDENGEAFALLKSTESGTATVTLTSGTASDSGTVVFAALDARNLDCLPDTATNPTGTSHVIECTATDRYGNPTSDEGTLTTVTISESGAGRITSGTTPSLGADGTLEVIVETSNGEEGTQTITAEFTDDVGDTDVFATDNLDACDQPANDGDTAGTGPVDTGAPAGNCEDTVEKVWEDVAQPQCNNGIDDDGDGFIDYPFDPGCENQTDDDEIDPPGPEIVRHKRSISIRFVAPQQRRDGMIVKGRVRVADGFNACRRAVPVKVQRRTRGQWVTRKSTTTNRRGRYAVEILPTHSRFRAVATRFLISDPDANKENVCRTARKVKRYRGRL